MIEAKDFLDPAVERGFTFWTGVPCSILTPFINGVIQADNLDYLGAASEGEAVGIAAGAHLAGRRTVVICQNSGLGNTVNPLTSLNFPFRIPTLLITTHRGAPGINDEPQHELMGQIIHDLIDAMRLPRAPFPTEAAAVGPTLDEALVKMQETGLPFVLVMPKGVVQKTKLGPHDKQCFRGDAEVVGTFTRADEGRMSRRDAIRIVRAVVGEEAPLIATTGKTGRELFTLGHRHNQLYVVGSMGCASALGLGLHQAARSDGWSLPVVVLDGDGAVLMKMGALATIGHYAPAGLVHVILDNEVHDSTGGQFTVSPSVDFATVAVGCGYPKVWRVDDPDLLPEVVSKARFTRGPCLIHIKVAPGADSNLGRPTQTPVEVKEGLIRWLSSRKPSAAR